MSEEFVEPTTLRDPAIGATVNGYRIVGRLGQGGMGLVYEGLEPDIGKRVAIKVLRPELAADATFLTRLLDEARAVNAIRHRGIIDIFGAGTLPDGRKCLVMEFLDGTLLEAEIQAAAQENRTLPLLRVLDICDEVLNALDAAHLANIVHRDLKPSNIFLCRQPNGDQHVKVLDFGIAKVAASGGVTHASAVLGTPLYMAPEQATADRLTPAVDVYAFGVILFELLTSRVPFSGESVARVMYHHINTRPPLVSELNPAVPAALDALVATLLAKDPAARPTAAEARRQLSRLHVALSDPTAMPTLDTLKSVPADTVVRAKPTVAPEQTVPLARTPTGPQVVEQTAPLARTPAAMVQQTAPVARAPATAPMPVVEQTAPLGRAPATAPMPAVPLSRAPATNSMQAVEQTAPLPAQARPAEALQTSDLTRLAVRSGPSKGVLAAVGGAVVLLGLVAVVVGRDAAKREAAPPAGAVSPVEQAGPKHTGAAPNVGAAGLEPARGEKNVVAPTGANGLAAPTPGPDHAPGEKGAVGTLAPEVTATGAAHDPTRAPTAAPAVAPHVVEPADEAARFTRRVAPRLKALDAAIARARSRNEDVDVTERQLTQLKLNVAKAKTREAREAVEVVLARLEDELRE